jgi:hypothetical protein
MNKQNKLFAAHGIYSNAARMADRCPTAAAVGAGELKGYRLLFKGAHAEAVAALEADKDSSVPVMIWELTPADEVTLDRYEGYPDRCVKETVKVKLEGKTVSAMVYILKEGVPPGRPGAYHYDSIMQGYEAAGFDVEILREALLTSIKLADALEEKPS